MARLPFMVAVVPLLSTFAFGFGIGLGGCTDQPINAGASDPGALVAATMDSQVGVLLDEVPPAMRDRVAGRLIAQPEKFWVDRAKAQVALTSYRLNFRGKFYKDQGKAQLPLPVDSLWTITLTRDAGGAISARRATVEGHDLVLVSYSLSTTVVTTVDSPAKAEPALKDTEGFWDEPFTLPLDPELLVQRTGYACMDEAESPPSSVDSESAAVFYDQDCDVEAALSASGCHQSALPEQSCKAALTAKIGKVDTRLHFQRVAWSRALADQFRLGPITAPSNADIRAGIPGTPPARVVYRYIPADSCTLAERCVGAPGWRRLLQFSSVNWNVGGKALDIGPVSTYIDPGAANSLAPHNLYELSACHKRYNFTHYGTFTFGKMDPAASKRGLCLQSTSRISNHELSPLTTPYGTCSYQGIESGWADRYQAGIDCQWIDVTGVDVSQGPVTSTLQETFNPDQLLCEGQPVKDAAGQPVFETTHLTTADGRAVDRPKCSFMSKWDANNINNTDVTLPAAGEGFVTQACARGQLGALKNCGFKKQEDLRTCTPGSTVALRCTIPVAAPPQVVRLCESSVALQVGTACTAQDALTSTAVEAGAGVTVSFKCPAARGTDEPGGRYSIYGGPVFTEDNTAPVTCSPLVITAAP